ncbi:MAG: hypothetical protein JSV79_00150 [Armatimonadota bacterium]|nr:MAG: hypothetical protein JSV79_00150 [Armatimonadota bacterium]
MRRVAVFVFWVATVLGVVVVGFQLMAMLSAGRGAGMTGVGEAFCLVLGEPAGKWGLACVILGVLGLVLVGAAWKLRGEKPTEAAPEADEEAEGEG